MAVAVTDEKATRRREAVEHVSRETGMSARRINAVINSYAQAIRRQKDERGIKAPAEPRIEISPTKERELKGDLVDSRVFLEGSDTRTLETRRAQDAIDRYISRKLITSRQAEAAMRLRADYEFGVIGASSSSDLLRVRSGRFSGIGEAQLAACEQFRGAVAAIGPTTAGVVVAFCCNGEDMAMIARRMDPQRRTTGKHGHGEGIKAQQLRWQLAAGLDIVGDFYKLPVELARELVILRLEDGSAIEARMCYRHEANDMFAGVTLNDIPWLAEARSVADLVELARTMMRKRWEERS